MGRPMSNAEFFDNDPQRSSNRENFAIDVLNQAIDFLLNQNGDIAIHDATNSVPSRRKRISDVLQKYESAIDVIWIESIVTDDKVKDQNIALKSTSPDYLGVPPDLAVADFRKRLSFYEEKYVALHLVGDKEKSFIQIMNGGEDYFVHRVSNGNFQSQLKNFLLNYSLKPIVCWLTRHGESAWNQEQRIGGNPELSENGKRYALALGKFVELHPELIQAQITCSTLLRSQQTIEFCPNLQRLTVALLSEINAGICEGMTYDEIKDKMPEISRARSQDKLGYRYPGGESYIDILNRLQPLILEIERTHKPYFIVGHQAILRAILAYFYTLANERIPFLEVPLHTLFKFESTHFGYTETQYHIDLDRYEAGDSIFWVEQNFVHSR
jgi:broad specificity phosphatase PhoE